MRKIEWEQIPWCVRVRVRKLDVFHDKLYHAMKEPNGETDTQSRAWQLFDANQQWTMINAAEAVIRSELHELAFRRGKHAE
jgi:hypothetical protein